jgi:hypothetical protein
MLYLARSRINVPWGRQVREFSRLIEKGPKVHLEANFRRDLELLRLSRRVSFREGFGLELVIRAGGASFGEAH